MINQEGLSTEFMVHKRDGMRRKLQNPLKKAKHKERKGRVKMKKTDWYKTNIKKWGMKEDKE